MILSNIYIGMLIVAAVGETALGTSIIDMGSKLGNMTSAGVLGCVAITALFMLKKLYIDKSEDSKVTREIAMKAVAAIEENSVKTDTQIKLLEAMHNDISLCRKLNTEKMNKAGAEDHLKTFGSK